MKLFRLSCLAYYDRTRRKVLTLYGTRREIYSFVEYVVPFLIVFGSKLVYVGHCVLKTRLIAVRTEI